MSNIFEEIQEHAKDFAEGFDIEHAVQVVPSQGVVVSGVQFEAQEFHCPLFLSSGDLRALADESERLTQEYINNS